MAINPSGGPSTPFAAPAGLPNLPQNVAPPQIDLPAAPANQTPAYPNNPIPAPGPGQGQNLDLSA